MDDAVHLGRALSRVQLIVGTATAAMLTALAWLTSEWWRISAVAVVACAMIANRWFRRPDQLGPERGIEVFMALALVAQGAVIIVTGGIRSPIIVVWGVIGWVAGFVLRPVMLLRLLLIPLVTTLLLATMALYPQFGPEWLALDLSPAVHGWVLACSAITVLLFLAVGADLGQRIRRIQNELRETAIDAQREVSESLREKNHALVTLTAAVAHELKNPLSAVLALSTLLEERARREQRADAEQLRVMVAETRRMGTILEELLSFARPGDRLTMQDVALAPLLGDVFTVHEGLAEPRGVRFMLAGDQGLTVRADMRKLKQILTNLQQNALDASPEGGVIQAELRALDEAVEVMVCDQGDGIDPEVRGRLFVPGVSGKVAGSGLGLAISRMLAESQGGELRIENAAEGGCRTVLRLPASRSET